MEAKIADVGYINDQRQHAMISIYKPVILNSVDDWVQVVISIENATVLRDKLDAFLLMHCKKIVVEDGTGVSGANSYLSEVEAEEFWNKKDVS